jgi:branched-chain amino acid transport system substrate-binding protein
MNKKRTLRRSILLIAACLVAAIAAGCSIPSFSERPAAENVVRIGALWPMTGPMSGVGMELMNGANLAAEIINGDYPDLTLPLAKGKGLPKLGGVRVVIVSGNHQGVPEKCMNETERLITQEKVAALLGAYQNGTTAAAIQVAERYGIPLLDESSTAPSLTARGYKWLFRMVPDDTVYISNYYQLLQQLKTEELLKEVRLGIVHDNTPWSIESGKAAVTAAKEQKYAVTAEMTYQRKNANFQSDVTHLKNGKAGIVLQTACEYDAGMLLKAYKDADYNPQGILSLDPAIIAPEFLKKFGKDANGLFSREVWSLDLAEYKSMIAKVNKLYKDKYGGDMTSNAARAFTAVLVLAEAMNRAGSVEPVALQKALESTNIPGEQTIMPWKGIKFEAKTHQNLLGSAIIIQVQNGRPVTVWPTNWATKSAVWPVSKWSERK